MDNLNIIEIKNEYKRIDFDWLRLHLKTSMWLVIFSLVIEFIMGYILYIMGEIHITIFLYILKYLIAPFILNSLFIIIGYNVTNSPRLNQNFKMHIISLLFAGICFVLFSVHGIFSFVGMIFIIPILFTIVYGNYWLTTITTFFSLFLYVISEFFITWDPDKLNILSSNIELANFSISVIIMLVFYAITLVVIRFERSKNAVSIQKELDRYELRHRLRKDELTGINNKTALRDAFKKMEEDESSESYYLGMIDLDDFKMLNDTLGHHNGDIILAKFGEILKRNKNNANPFRFGGDEFCILFKNQNLEAIIQKCEKIQREFEEIDIIDGTSLKLTASFGIAQYTNNISATQLLKNADAALYKAKSEKNTIYIYDDEKISSYQKK
ncbi:MAG: GGDEF domain-containing protein [Firmicutes bacterium]|nr:GGDEF domain-containing protein [Bacillota bacterium]